MLIHKKIISVLTEIKAIRKLQVNDVEKYNFRGVDDVYNAVHPLFQKHGVFSTSEIVGEQYLDAGRTILDVKFTFWAEDGTSVCTICKGEAFDKTGNGTSKAMSIAHKQALIQMFLIPTADGTPETTPKGDLRPWISEAQFKKIKLRIPTEKDALQLLFKVCETYRIKNSYYDELLKIYRETKK